MEKTSQTSCASDVLTSLQTHFSIFPSILPRLLKVYHLIPLLELFQNLMWACLKFRFPIAVLFYESLIEFYNIIITNGPISAVILCTARLSCNTQRKCPTLIGLITRVHYIITKGVSFCKAGVRSNIVIQHFVRLK